MKIFIGLSTITFLICCSSAFGQSKRVIKGRINSGGLPVEYVTITLINQNDSNIVSGTITDSLGKYQFEVIKMGFYLVKASYIGYLKSFSQPVAIGEGDTIVVVKDVELKPDGKTHLKEVTVVGQKDFVEQKIDRTVINVNNSILSKGSSALEILESAPGVGVGSEGSFSLRGKDGVLVLINDKPTYLSAADLVELLRNTPGSKIETIELMANPPSNYEAQGTSGIINIKMKKNNEFGPHYSINTSGGYGKYYKWGAGATVDIKTKRINFNANYFISSNKRFNDQNIERINSNAGILTFFNQVANRVRKIDYQHFNIGMDYTVTENSSIKFLIDGSFNKASQLMLNNTQVGSQFNSTDSILKSVDPLKSHYSDLRYNLNYSLNLDTIGSKFNIDLNYGKFQSKELTNYFNNYYLPSGSVLRPSDTLQISSPNDISIYSFNSDYSYHFHNNKYILNLGLKSSVVKTDNNFAFDSLKNGVYENTILSNHFLYTENINALYFNLLLNLKTLSIELGVRGEQTNSSGKSISSDQVVTRSYVDLFPSLFIERKFSSGNSVNFSYSRRIDRPDYEDLNPFVYYLDQFTYSQGNPYLKPQYSNSLNLSYSFNQKYILSLGYIFVNQVMSEIVKTDSLSKTLIFTYANLARQTGYNFSINLPINITSWWSDVNYVNLYYTDIQSNGGGLVFDKQKYSYSATINNSFKISKGFKSEVNFSYQSPYIVGTVYYNKPFYGVDFGLNKSFLKNKLNLNFVLKDIFNTRARWFTSLLPDQQYQYHQKLETRVATLSLSYQFGGTKTGRAKDRTVGSQEESDRIRGAN